MSVTGKSVTINLSAANHFNSGTVLFKEGEKVKLAKHLWERTQRTKNKRFVARLFKKPKFEVYSNILKVNQGGNETVLTLSPFKF